jgi:hypothetical protein
MKRLPFTLVIRFDDGSEIEMPHSTLLGYDFTLDVFKYGSDLVEVNLRLLVDALSFNQARQTFDPLSLPAPAAPRLEDRHESS